MLRLYQGRQKIKPKKQTPTLIKNQNENQMKNKNKTSNPLRDAPPGRLYKNKYQIESTRLREWDYSADGYYFVTICTENKECFFGDVKNEEMKLNEIGKVAHKYWSEIPNHFPFVALDEFVVMPNHVHGIIIINKANVETLHATSLPRQRQQKYRGQNSKLSKISPQKYSLSSIMRSYKSAISRDAKNINPHFAWQPRYYDHIIRNENELNQIREYIINNPLKWELDRNHPDNLKKMKKFPHAKQKQTKDKNPHQRRDVACYVSTKVGTKLNVKNKYQH